MSEFSKVSRQLHVAYPGGAFKWEVADVGKLMQYFVDECPPFSEMMASVGGDHPARPLHMVFYLDGITPGNMLRPDNKRKIWAFYASFKEFGAERLCNEEVWFTLAVLRHNVEHEFDGKVSCAAKHLLHLVASCGQAGVFLNTTVPKIVYFKISNVVADEEGLKSVYACKGASGIKPCMLCRNVVSTSSLLSAFATAGDLIDTTCTDVRKFALNTDRDVWHSVDRLIREHGTLGKGEFDMLEKASGFTMCQNGVLADVALRTALLPVTTWTYDWMHVYLSNGIMSHELHLMLSDAKKLHKISYSTLNTFVGADWRFPSHTMGRQRSAAFFSDARERASSDTFKAMASEVLLIYPLVRHFCFMVLERLGGMMKQLQSFYAACDSVDMLRRAKECDRTFDVDQLQLQILRHGCLHQSAYGKEGVKPKHHYAYHVPHQVQRDGLLLDTFVLERKHQPIKARAQHVKNTVVYERSVMARAMIDQSRKLKAFVSKSLIGTVKSTGTVEISHKLKWCGTTVAIRDVVVVTFGDMEGIPFEIHGCTREHASLAIVGHVLTPAEQPTPNSWRCERDERLVNIDLHDGHRVQHVHAWTVGTDGVYLILAAESTLS